MQKVISGLELSTYRKNNNLTVPAMAALAGIPEATIRDFENDTRSMTLAMFQRVQAKMAGTPTTQVNITVARKTGYRGCCGS